MALQAAAKSHLNSKAVMDLSITGEVASILEEESGEGRKGTWRKRSFILRTRGDYPKDICILQWGDSIDKFAVQEGETITAHIDIQSREYNGRWYTDVKAWKIERADGPGAKPPASDDSPPPEEPDGPGDDDDTLPF